MCHRILWNSVEYFCAVLLTEKLTIANADENRTSLAEVINYTYLLTYLQGQILFAGHRRGCSAANIGDERVDHGEVGRRLWWCTSGVCEASVEARRRRGTIGVQRLRTSDRGPVPAVRHGTALARRLPALLRLSDAAGRFRSHLLHASRAHPVSCRLSQVRPVSPCHIT